VRHLRITNRDPDGTLRVDQIPLEMILRYAYWRGADESDTPSRLELALDTRAQSFPQVFQGSQADEVARALRLHRPPMREEVPFGAMVHDDQGANKYD
jgi:hypothetical protein